MPATLAPINGIVQNVSSFGNNCCELQVTIRNTDGIHNFIVGPDTYVAGQSRLRPGMPVTAFYDTSLPIPLIFPPRYQAVIISRRNPRENIFAGYFDANLTAEDNALKLNIGRYTEIITSNGQQFNCQPGEQMLLVPHYIHDVTGGLWMEFVACQK